MEKKGKFTINVNPRNKANAIFIRGFIVLSAGVPTHPLFILIFRGGNVAYNLLKFRQSSSVCSSSVHRLRGCAVMGDGGCENYGRYRFFLGRRIMKHRGRNDDWTIAMWELQGRCSASRARFRLKLYELAVKWLGDVGLAQISLALRPLARLEYFYPNAKDAFSRHRSRLFIVHLCMCIHICAHTHTSRCIPSKFYLFFAKKRRISFANVIKRDKSSVDFPRFILWENQEFSTFADFYPPAGRHDIFYQTYFRFRHVKEAMYIAYSSWRYFAPRK